MRKRMTYLLLMCILLLGSSCKRRPLYDEDVNVHISFDFDRNIPHVNTAKLPELMKVNFFRAATADLKHHFFLKPEGGYADISYYTYNISAFNYDTEFTQIRYEDDMEGAEAYTDCVQTDPMSNYNRLFRLISEYRAQLDGNSSLVEDYTDQPLMNQPDHLYSGQLNGVCVDGKGEDDICEIVIPVSSIVKTYRLEIGTITGMENILSADAFITGQAMSKNLQSKQVTGQAGCLHTGLAASKTNSGELTALFNTFDRHPGKHAYVVLQITDLDGNLRVWEWDVTDQFNDETNKERVIRVNQNITIDPPVNEDMQPVVNLWDEIYYDIIL